MKTLAATLIIVIMMFFSTGVQAEKQSKDLQMNMHIMMHLMSHGLNLALEGANLQMLGYMGMANERLDKDTIKHGAIMLKDGRLRSDLSVTVFNLKRLLLDYLPLFNSSLIKTYDCFKYIKKTDY